MTYAQGIAVGITVVVAFAAAAVGAAIVSQSVVAAILAILGFVIGLFFGSRVTGVPQRETAASRTLRRWMVPIIVIGGLFVLPQVDKVWPGSVFGVLSIVFALVAGYLIANAIQTRRKRVARARELQGWNS